MQNSYYFTNIQKDNENEQLLCQLEAFANRTSTQVYVIDRPLGDKKYSYSYQKAAVILIPKTKILITDYGNGGSSFEEFFDDFIEDLGALSDKYRYKDFIGRPRNWKENIILKTNYCLGKVDIVQIIEGCEISGSKDQKICELLISLLTGSINNIERVKAEVPNYLLDKIKQKIILFDGDQTRFIYEEPEKHEIRIQGLSGTGKTELLLHKMKEVYVTEASSKILLTCHNKILAHSLRNRIPSFFNFLKVEQQIEWNTRLLCVHAWGSMSNKYSGAYSYICNFYGIDFVRYSYMTPFHVVCKSALEEIQKKKISDGANFSFAFDYIFIDESQDFPASFIDLCSIVTRKTLYIAGDIFQSIFDENIINIISPDHLLSKCYRTDPRTLMFAHALGMGLFEKVKLRWLEDEEWKACGYTFEKNNNTYILKREPLKRFEDLQNNSINSIELKLLQATEETDICNHIIDLINTLRIQNPTLEADDIGIIFLDGTKQSYLLADMLELSLPRQVGWKANKTYESKEKVCNAVAVSNRNNVKGLEFPFVICITSGVRNSYAYRNALYTMLTRSFIQSVLIITDEPDLDFKNSMLLGLKEININGRIVVNEPSEAEKALIRTTINQREHKKSLFDEFYTICDEIGIIQEVSKKLYESFLKISDGKNITSSYLDDWINANYQLLVKNKRI
jgi:superfamily I DNA and RNA helicase